MGEGGYLQETISPSDFLQIHVCTLLQKVFKGIIVEHSEKY